MDKYSEIIPGDKREHVTSYFYEDPEIKKINILNEEPNDFTSVRLVLDYQEDLTTLKEIVLAFCKKYPHTCPIENMNYSDIKSLEIFKIWKQNPHKSPNASHLVQNSLLYI